MVVFHGCRFPKWLCSRGVAFQGGCLLILTKRATSRRQVRASGIEKNLKDQYRKGETKVEFNASRQYRPEDFDYIEVPAPEPCGAGFTATPKPFSFDYQSEYEDKFDIAIEDAAGTGGQQTAFGVYVELCYNIEFAGFLHSGRITFT